MSKREFLMFKSMLILEKDLNLASKYTAIPGILKLGTVYWSNVVVGILTPPSYLKESGLDLSNDHTFLRDSQFLIP